MDSYQFILDVAVILIFTKALGLLSRKVNMPQVVGSLLAGLLLGPAFLGIIKDTNFIKSVAEIGVIILMFSAGLETDINGLKKCGKAAFIIALCGVLVPLAGGFAVAYFLLDDNGSFLSEYTPVLPEDSTVTVPSGKKLVGWSTEENSDTVMESIALENTDIELYPVFADADYAPKWFMMKRRIMQTPFPKRCLKKSSNPV